MNIPQARPGPGDIFIYDVIDKGFAENIIRQLKTGIPATLRINSPGGSVFEALAAFNALATHQAGVSIQIDGACLSAAMLFVGLGNTLAAPNSLMMIHGPRTEAAGDANELRKIAEMLDKVSGNMADIFARKTRKAAEYIQTWMTQDTWFNASEALTAGLIDGLTSDIPVVTALHTGSMSIPARYRVTAHATPTQNPVANMAALSRKLFQQVSAGGFQ